MDALLAFPAILLAIALMAVPLGLLAGYVGGRLAGLVKDGPRTRDRSLGATTRASRSR
jgi:hypothetical protein